MTTGNSEYTLALEKIEAVIRRWLPENPGPSWLEGIFSLPGDGVQSSLVNSLSLPGRDLVNRGGKRWRPLLMYLTAMCAGGEAAAEAALGLTPLVEFPHNASLIHDDIEDNSDERRGKPAVHLIYGNDTAINSGAFFYFLPLACIEASDFPVSQKLRIYQSWGLHMRRLHLGQAMDIAWHRNFLSLPSPEEYEKMCRLKTGCLAGLAARLGFYCTASGDDALAEELGEGAEKLGVGFQILDDVKNLSGGIAGKKLGDDVVEGKKSLPVLLYLRRCPEKRDFAAACFAAARAGGVASPEVGEFIRALERAGVIEEARQKGLGLIEESRNCFSGLKFAQKDLLIGLIDLIS